MCPRELSDSMNLKEAIETGDAESLQRLLSEAPERANELIRWGEHCRIATHPLHFISDMHFAERLKPDQELPLVDALIDAGADVNFQKPGGETALIGAASLLAEDVGLRLLERGARPEVTGIFGETALHWAAIVGADRLVRRLVERGAPLNLKDRKYSSTPLGWARHGQQNPSPKGGLGRYDQVIACLVDAGGLHE